MKRQSGSGSAAREVSRRKLLERSGGATEGRHAAGATLNRRAALRGLSALVAGGGLGSRVAAHDSHDDGHVPVPDVEGPVTGGARTGRPMSASVADVARYGYLEEEYLVSGTARGAGGADDTAPYTTRIIVHRPVDRRDFNGTLVVNWPNVTEQTDVPFSWANKFDHAMRNGYAMAIASVQKQGVDGSPLALQAWDPARYADVRHPGDEYSFDMFSQAVQALRHRPRPSPDPLRGLAVRNVIACGISQSASRLHDYIDGVQAAHGVVDGFIPESIGPPESPEAIRDDLVPILWVNTETEVWFFGGSATGEASDPREDGGLFRLWEVAGATHTNNNSMTFRDKMKQRDHGTVVGVGRDPDWNPEAVRQYGERGGSACPYNLFPHQYATRAALDQLDRWVRTGSEPTDAPRIEREAGGVETDEFGNALGGLRLPVIDVPVAQYENGRCMPMRGRTRQFDESTLHALYPTKDDYLDDLESAVEKAVGLGWLTETDAGYILQHARSSSIPNTG
jgi:hypothetical protein